LIAQPTRKNTPAGARRTPITHDLAGLRMRVRREALRSVGSRRAQDVVLAVDEAATNTLMHGGEPGWLSTWEDGEAFVAEVSDNGRLEDLCAGTSPPGTSAPDGRGLWIIRQVCDRVELASGPDGTTVRMRFEPTG
jgi:anti-sigma regulatory factor (Ser/Thr protein kinase)